MRFNGFLKIRVGEAVGLKPTSFSTRHSIRPNVKSNLLDPYIVAKVDDVRIGQTETKSKTNSPTYNEVLCSQVSDAKVLELAVFHDTPIGYDDFVANCTFQLEDMMNTTNTRTTFEGWVSKASTKCRLQFTVNCFKCLSPGTVSRKRKMLC